MEILEEKGHPIEKVDAIAARGGLLRPIESGTYEINERMVEDLKSERYGSHASNGTGIIGYELGQKYNIPVYTVNPTSVDELEDVYKRQIHNVQARVLFTGETVDSREEESEDEQEES